MVEISNRVKVEFTSTLTLNETEMRALDAIVGYGFKSFIENFKKVMGTSYIRGHESGAEDLFHAIGRDVRPALRQIDEMRDAIVKENKRKLEVGKVSV